MLTGVTIDDKRCRYDLTRVNGAGYLSRGDVVIMKVPRYKGLYMARVAGICGSTVTFDVLNHPRGIFYCMMESNDLPDNVYKIN